ncbi:MAG TPA: SAM-dependent chlorinase/fluorinase [Arenicellales bacterium]|nr:SAM-dependent chlorinase/fluorinase [Arenicellales bacterium]
MIVLMTDFGSADPYAGLMRAAISRVAEVPVLDLLHEMPNYDARAGAYLVDALQRQFEPGTVFVCVVDPGVGGDRAPVMVEADGKWYVGPDNGLFNIVCRRAAEVKSLRIDWRPGHLSSSFHGRDLFAPVAAGLATGVTPAHTPWTLVETPDWPEDLPEVVYVDHYGNAMTGIRADSLSRHATVDIGDTRLPRGATFASHRPGEAFWYRNSLDLVEIAVREGSAAASLGLRVGDTLKVTDYGWLLDPDSP